MRLVSAAAMDAYRSGEVIETGALVVFCTPMFAVWGGWGSLTLTIDGQEIVFTGIGSDVLVTETGGALGGEEQGMEINLSGVDPDVTPLREATGLRNAPVIVCRLVFDGTGANLLDMEVRRRGRVDEAPGSDTPGGESVITLKIEGAARGAGRQGARMRTDADTRLINGNDGGHRRIAHAGDVTLYWGGKKPERAGTALSGSYGNSIVGRALTKLAQANDSDTR